MGGGFCETQDQDLRIRMSKIRIRIWDQISRLAEETGSAVVLVGGGRR